MDPESFIHDGFFKDELEANLAAEDSAIRADICLEIARELLDMGFSGYDEV